MAIGRIGTGPHFRIYCFSPSGRGKEEGTIRWCIPKGNRYIVDPNVEEEHFDRLDDIPDKIRSL